MHAGEEWRQVTGLEGLYWVSSKGRVKSRSIVMRPTINNGSAFNNGYHKVSLSMPGGAQKKANVHVLVLEAFVSQRPTGCVARHLDGNGLNNDLKNLLWGTHLENMADRSRHGKNKRKLCFEGAERIRETTLFGAKAIDLAAVFDVSTMTISKINTNASWKTPSP